MQISAASTWDMLPDAVLRKWNFNENILLILKHYQRDPTSFAIPAIWSGHHPASGMLTGRKCAFGSIQRCHAISLVLFIGCRGAMWIVFDARDGMVWDGEQTKAVLKNEFGSDT